MNIVDFIGRRLRPELYASRADLLQQLCHMGKRLGQERDETCREILRRTDAEQALRDIREACKARLEQHDQKHNTVLNWW